LFILWIVLFAPVIVAQDEKQNRKTEDWVYIENEDLRVGFLRSHGGAMAYLSSRNSDVNTLNHYDHGRLVQQSYYGDEDGSQWGDKPWRYNPVQGGDYKGHAATVVEFSSTATSTYCKTIPRNWAAGDLLNDCVMEQWTELDGPILQVRYKFNYSGPTTHQPRHQETPAVFVAPQFSELVTYSGKLPWTGASLSRRKPGWPNEYLTLSENWAAYVDPNNIGVGVFVPDSMEATCYRFQGGANSSCSYIAPLRTFALTPNLTFSYTAYFTTGDTDTIRSRFVQLHQEQQK
jgi:hypothetical protein